MMEQWQKGEFCWTEISVTDVKKAQEFYHEVLGWEYSEHDMGDGHFYYMWKVNGIESGGMYALNPEQTKQGVPPHWLNYFYTDSTDKFVESVNAGNGQVMMPAMDVGQMGRMAVMSDPTGAAFACWQPLGENQKIQAERFSHGKVAWRELLTNNVEAAGAFYNKVVGWDIESQDMGDFKYHSYKRGDSYEAGMMAIQADWGAMPSCWVTYVNVDDCDAAVAKIEKLGGKAHMPPRDIPQVGRFCLLNDPQGAIFAVITMPRDQH